MRVYVGEQDEAAGKCRVWVVQELPRPEISEVVEVLGDLNRLMDLRRDGITAEQYEQHRARTLARKDEIVDEIRRAEAAPRPTELVHRGLHSPDGFEWGYAGSGPADLAYSILFTEIGEPPTAPVYLRFRDDVIAKLQGRSFRLPADVVWEWIGTNRSLVEAELFDKIPPPGATEAPAMAVTHEAPAEGVTLDEASGSAVVRACEQAWRDIQSHHPELPDVVVILGTGVERGRLVKLGHWWGGRWIADGQARGEVLLAGEALHLPPAQVFEVLLHEAAHGLNAARRVPDTSRGGRYHNRRFALTANEVLLDAAPMPPYGFAATKLTREAEDRYGPTIERLGDAMRIARHIGRGVKVGVETESQLGGGREGGTVDRDRTRNEAVTALCGCGRRMRMAPSVYQQGPVVCGVCGSAFRDGAERRTEPAPGNEVVDRTFVQRRRAAIEGEPSARERHTAVISLLDAQRARLEAALGVAGTADAPGLQLLRDRLRHIDHLLGSTDAPRAASAEPTDLQAEGIRELLATQLPRDDTTVDRWYETFGTPDEHPMPLGEFDDAHNRAARALLKADGTLREPRVEIGDRELLVGERVVTTKGLSGRGLDAGVPGTVEAIEPACRGVAIDFATWGRLEISVGQMLDAGIAHDYVATAATPAQKVDLSEELAIEASRIDPGMGW